MQLSLLAAALAAFATTALAGVAGRDTSIALNNCTPLLHYCGQTLLDVGTSPFLLSSQNFANICFLAQGTTKLRSIKHFLMLAKRKSTMGSRICSIVLAAIMD
jgi:hypothetical protein